VRAGRGQVGRAGCALLRAAQCFQALKISFAQLEQGSAFAYGKPSALRFKTAHSPCGQSEEALAALKTYNICITDTLEFKPPAMPRESRQPASRLNTRDELRLAFFSGWSCDGSLGAIV
jgi:hypothetical protein